MVTSGLKWVYNTQIHLDSGLNPSQFLNKIVDTESIRKGYVLSFNLFPANRKEYLQNNKIWDFVNGNQEHIHDNFKHYFAINFPEQLYHFLTGVSKKDMYLASLTGLCLIYLSSPKERAKIEKSLYKPLLDKMHSLILEHFPQYYASAITDKKIVFNEEDMLFIFNKSKEICSRQPGSKYILAFMDPFDDGVLSGRRHWLAENVVIVLEASYAPVGEWKPLIDELKNREFVPVSSGADDDWESWKTRFKNN